VKVAKHLGTKINMRCKIKKQHDNNKVSSHVAYRVQIARTMLKIMRIRGLGIVGIGAIPTIKMIRMVLIPSLTYGMTSIDLTKADKKEIRHVVMEALHLIYRVPASSYITKYWMMVEAGIVDPIDALRITDICTVCKAKEGKINPRVSDIILNDPGIMASLTPVMDGWEVTWEEIEGWDPKTRSSELKEISKTLQEGRLQNEIRTKQRFIIQPEEIIDMRSTIIETFSENKKALQINMLLRAAAMFGRKSWCTPCPFCPGNEPHNPAHIIHRCALPIMEAVRKNILQHMNDSSTHVWMTMDTETIIHEAGPAQ
jgi:hypothetical protein